jgi:hypothetical protein
MFAFLETQACGSEDIRFDIEEAIYWFAAAYHGGQWTNLYAALSTSDYTPGMFQNMPNDGLFYDMLVAEYANPEGN